MALCLSLPALLALPGLSRVCRSAVLGGGDSGRGFPEKACKGTEGIGDLGASPARWRPERARTELCVAMLMIAPILSTQQGTAGSRPHRKRGPRSRLSSRISPPNRPSAVLVRSTESGSTRTTLQVALACPVCICMPCLGVCIYLFGVVPLWPIVSRSPQASSPPRGTKTLD